MTPKAGRLGCSCVAPRGFCLLAELTSGLVRCLRVEVFGLAVVVVLGDCGSYETLFSAIPCLQVQDGCHSLGYHASSCFFLLLLIPPAPPLILASPTVTHKTFLDFSSLRVCLRWPRSHLRKFSTSVLLITIFYLRFSLLYSSHYKQFLFTAWKPKVLM